MTVKSVRTYIVEGTLIGIARVHVCRCNPGVRNTMQCSLVCGLNILLLQTFRLKNNCTRRCHFGNKRTQEIFWAGALLREEEFVGLQ